MIPAPNDRTEPTRTSHTPATSGKAPRARFGGIPPPWRWAISVWLLFVIERLTAGLGLINDRGALAFRIMGWGSRHYGLRPRVRMVSRSNTPHAGTE